MNYNYTYRSFNDYISSGIYSQEDIEQSHKSMLYPYTISSAEHIWIMQMYMNDISQYGLNITKGVDSISLKGWFKSQFTTIWGWFHSIGDIFTGFFGIYIVYKISCTLISQIIDAYNLHKLFGFSWKLLLALLSGVTSGILYMYHHRDNNTDKNQVEPDEIPLANTTSSQNDNNNDSRSIYPDLSMSPENHVNTSFIRDQRPYKLIIFIHIVH